MLNRHRQPVARGLVHEIEVTSFASVCSVRLYLYPDGDFHTWLGLDKRLWCVAAAPPFADADAFLAVLLPCLNRGQRIWLRRWLARED